MGNVVMHLYVIDTQHCAWHVIYQEHVFYYITDIYQVLFFAPRSQASSGQDQVLFVVLYLALLC